MGKKNRSNVLSGVGSVVHQQQLNILNVVDEESLVAGGHHVAGLLVVSVSDLSLLAHQYVKLLLFICLRHALHGGIRSHPFLESLRGGGT